MYENDTNSIKRAQEGDKFELERLIKYNNRTHMEYSKKVSRKRIWIRGFISNRMYRIYKIDKEIWYKLWSEIIYICSTIYDRWNKKIHKRWWTNKSE